MFAPNNPITAARAEIYCEEAIYKYEPRISTLSVKARPSPGHPNRLDVAIEFTIAEQTNKRNLVFPFYLKDPDEEGTPSRVTAGLSVPNGTSSENP
jgi:phage baseplate assembly protein W